MTALQAIKGWITGDVNTLPTRSLEDLKKITRILFIDDQKFEVVQILINAGWANTERVQDVSSLDSPAIIDAHIVFVDIRGVGKKLQFHDEGLALIGALRQKYPYKKLVVYSAETTGDRFHKALSDADYRLSKNADPFQFQSLVEEYSRDAFSLAECVSRLQKIIRAEFGVNLTDEQIMARMRQLARRGDYSQHLVERVFNLSNAGSIASIVGLFMQPK